MVDLTAQPFNLDAEGVQWVKDTIAGMTDEEKIGQLFVNMGSSRDEEYLTDMVSRYHIGAVRYQPGPAVEIWEQNRILQEKSKIPMLIAANTEAGGNGACTDGTYVGWEVKIAATREPRYAYELGRISGVEAAAIGCNWSFAPIVDLYRNWRNPIISQRTWSADVEQTIELSLEYMRGIQESGIAPAAKHFPGDGIDERDQHLSSAPNWLSTEEWDATFGMVYSALIEAGLPSIMAGHIATPSITGDDTPACLSKKMVTDVLRNKLNYKGVVTTDSLQMGAVTQTTDSGQAAVAALQAGCDLLLMPKDFPAARSAVLTAVQNGTISETRLNASVTRILKCKAKLNKTAGLK